MNHSKSRYKPLLRCGRKLALASAIAAIAVGVSATPTDGVVIDGVADITYTDTTTDINQTTQNITINWQDFDIDIDETVTFYQPNSDSMALNRVLAGDGTQIMGRLNANGRVFVLDANGVLFGQNAQVNVGSLVASTLGISDNNFAAGNLTFIGTGTPAAVINLGSIQVADGGVVALLGGQVSNQGVIRARLGHVALASGNKITLDFAGDGLLNVQIDEAAVRALVYNGGLIQANGGSVLMTAYASGTLLNTVVNNQGVIEAQTLVEQGGRISLLGGFDGGSVVVGGVLDASAPNGGDGGFVETSGAVVNILPGAIVTTAAATGETGLWLIDPTNLELSYEGANNSTSHFSTQALQNNIATSNITIQTTAAGGGLGNITVVDPVIWAGGNTLTLDAHNNVIINDYIHAPDGGLTLNAVANITTGAEGHINVETFTLDEGNWSQIGGVLPSFNANNFILNGGTFTRATGGNGAATALQITDIYGLQGLQTTPALNAILTNDIDASSTATWNANLGFNPIGDSATEYSGDFDGAGFTVSGLTINRPTESNIGLFGVSLGTIANLGLSNVSIAGENQVGGISGANNGGEINNSYVTGSISGNDFVGGITGAITGVGSVVTSYSTASVTSIGSAGGLVGFNLNGTIDASYASGAVVGGTAGGLVGQNFAPGTITNSYFDSFTTGLGVGAGSDTNAQTIGVVSGDWNNNPDAYEVLSYANFDFTNDWFITEGRSRPMLRAFLNADGVSISNLYQLQGMSANLIGSYVLTQDINAWATADSVAAGNAGNNSDVWGGLGFASVGSFPAIFLGSIDGADHVVDGLSINRPDESAIGLIGTQGNSISNIGLTNVDIVGNEFVGGLVGWNSADIDNSFVTGSITGASEVGGLVGRNRFPTISNSYFTGSVTGVNVGNDSIAGLVGQNNGEIISSYSIANVVGDINVGGLVGRSEFILGSGINSSISTSYATGTVTGDENVGGLVGTHRGGASIDTSYATGEVIGNTNTGGLVGNNEASSTVDNAYFDSFTTGLANAFGVNAGIVNNISSVNGDWTAVPDAYDEATYTNLDFTNVWFIAEGTSRPMLRAFLDGNNISNLYHLQGMAANLGGSYTLTQNIDATATAQSIAAGNGGNFSDTWGGRGFAPIGTFTGSLNGNDYVINGLEIFRPLHNQVGVFSVLNGTVTNLGLTSTTIEGLDFTGGIAGVLNGGSITNSYLIGSVTGENAVGGLVGQNVLGTIGTSYAVANITTVTGIDIGGLVGRNNGGINNSYAIGTVTGANNIGGLVGNNAGAVTNAFWNTSLIATGIGTGVLVGATGLTTAEFTNLASFAAWGVTIDDSAGTGSVWRIYDGSTVPLLRSFLTEIDVIAYDDARVFSGSPYVGLHQINGTNGNGVRYGNTYAEFLDVFGENGTPYLVDDVNSVDLEYAGDSQGAVNAGVYDITPDSLWSSQQGYDIDNIDGTLTITAQALTVVAIDDKSKEYGEADPAFTWQITQGTLAPGDTLTGTMTRVAGENVGAYTITGNLTGDLTSSNYTVTLVNGVLTITPRSITVDIDNVNRPYGDDDPSFSWSVTAGSLLGNDELTASLLTRTPGENVGDYAITGVIAGSSNYTVTVNNGVLTITPRAITIDVASFAKLYGEDDPTFTWNVADGGLVFDETLTVTLTRDPGENVGAYAITGLTNNDPVSANYTITLNDGVLTITPRPITIQADDLVRLYGAEDPEFTWSISDGTVMDGDVVTVNLTREPGEDVRPEGYAITPTVEGDVESDNYQITLVDGTLQITPAPLIVTANDVISYWDLLPEFTATTEGLVLGDTEVDAFGNSLIVTSDLVLPLPDEYTLTPSVELATNNYTVNYETGTLTLLSSKGPDVDTYLPPREALGRQNRANIYEARELLDGRGDTIELLVLDDGQKLDPETLKSLGIPLPELVLFAVNSSVLSYEQNIMLKKLVQQMAEFPSLKLLVEGHTSSTGSAALNDPLSKRRARVVAEALVKFGLDATRVRTKNYGYRRAVANNDTLTGRALNRRAEINEDKAPAAE